jgi:outer membrane protein
MKAVWLTATIALVSIAYSLHPVAQVSPPVAPTKIAFVSSNRLVAAAPDIRAALERLQATKKQTVGELQQKQRALQETRSKMAQAPTPAARTELLNREKAQEAELTKLTVQAQFDVQASQREAQALLQSTLKPVLDEVAKGRGIDVVLNSDLAIVWGNPQLDITALVVERLNAAKAPAAPPK